MNAQLKNIARFLKILTLALMVSILLIGSMPIKVAHASTFKVNDLTDVPDPNLDGTCDISPGDGVDNCTLRAAIMEANRVDDQDVITFNVSMTLHIDPAEGALPAILHPVTINGKPINGSGWVTIDGDGLAGIGLDVQADNVYISQLVLIDFAGLAIQVYRADNVTIDGNRIGTPGNADGGNTKQGIKVLNSANAIITDNVISGNDLGGIWIVGGLSSGAVVTGNMIGLNSAGDTVVDLVSAGYGIFVDNVTHVTIGGSAVADRNVISGNGGYGIVIKGAATGTAIDGNYVGLSAIGEDALPNRSGGIYLDGASDASIGSGAGNLISGNAGSGVILSSADNITIENNVIGLDVDGDTDLGNTSHGINMAASSNVAITSNVLSANDGSGLRIVDGSTAVLVKSNRVGLAVGSELDLGNTSHGIHIDNSSDNMIGDTDTALGNRIAYNGGDGVYIANTTPATYDSYGNAIVGNKIYSNVGLGIDLEPNGITDNDTDDPDDGPNYLQNFAVFTAKKTTGGILINGSLNTDIASLRRNYRIEFFVSNTCDTSGYGEGTTRIDVYNLAVTANTTNIVDYKINTTSVAEGQFITATVTYNEQTGGLKDTSEFSPCAVVQKEDSPGSSGVFVVNSTGDASDATPGDKKCDVGGGECTLRAAIEEVNMGADPPYTISFNIAGATPHTISLTSALDTITTPVIIQGKPIGYTGAPIIVLDGSGAGASVDGLRVQSSDSVIDGLSIVNFSGAAVKLLTNGITVQNNYLGMDPDGATKSGNQSGVYVDGKFGNYILDNLISGNGYGIRLVGTGAKNNTIQGNYIGTDSTGLVDKGNSIDGIRIEGGNDNKIGGTNSGEGNLISGNDSDGIEVSGGSTGTKIYGNMIGIKANGASGLKNTGYGINLNSTSGNFVTNSNTIAYNGLSGVYVSSGTGNLISRNSIFGNTNSGIVLASGGNNNTPAPTLLSAQNGGTYAYIEGQLTGASPNTNYVLEFFSNDLSAQGETWIHSATVTTNASGAVNFGIAASYAVQTLDLITVTATDPSNNTSPFSNGVYVSTGPAATLTSTPTNTATNTPTRTNTPTNTSTPTNTPFARPTDTYTPTVTYTPSRTPTRTMTPTPTSTGGPSPTNTPTRTVTKTPTKTTTGSGNTATPTRTKTTTPTMTFTPTLLSQYQTLTMMASEAVGTTTVPTNTPQPPTSTLVPTATKIPETPTFTPVPPGEPTMTETLAPAAGGDTGGGLLGGSNFSVILYIFIGLSVLLLLIGGGMELIRWMNSRE